MYTQVRDSSNYLKQLLRLAECILNILKVRIGILKQYHIFLSVYKNYMGFLKTYSLRSFIHLEMFISTTNQRFRSFRQAKMAE